MTSTSMTTRNRAFTVALVGADGAGKTTIGRRLEREHRLPIRYLYMGVNPAAGDGLLPTTRLRERMRRGSEAPPGGPPDPARSRRRPARLLPRPRAATRSGLRTANLVAEEWYRQLRAWSYVRRGSIVVFDRHFLADYHAHDVTGRSSLPRSRRVHGFLLDRLYPRPDLVICLDAPADVLHARKAEGSVELLARRRQEYLDQAAGASDVVVIDASRPLDDVTADVFDAVSNFAGAATRHRIA